MIRLLRAVLRRKRRPLTFQEYQAERDRQFHDRLRRQEPLP